MKCRQCGIEIADRALICYRCGTATTEAKFKPVPIRTGRGSSSLWLALSLILTLVLVVLAINIERVVSGELPRIFAWAAAVAAALWAILVLRGSRRRR